MKRLICITVQVLLLTLILTACSSKGNSDIDLSKNSFENKDSYSYITIQSPMTLSNNDLFPINGEHQYLRLKMVKGKYYEDWTPGAYMGTIWEGYFTLELADEAGNVISQTDLDKIYKEPLIFNSSFQIEFDDYNDDRDIDFTIGQYASSNGRNYKIFTLRNDGKVEELTVRDYPSLLLSNTTGFYSTKLTKADNIAFETEYYDNSKGKNLKDTFRWNGKKFIKN